MEYSSGKEAYFENAGFISSSYQGSCSSFIVSILHQRQQAYLVGPPSIYLVGPCSVSAISVQHPPIKSAHPPLASSPLARISSISSKLLLPQKSFTPLTNRLLIFSTSGSSTAAKQILKYAQLRLSLISSVGANMEPGATSTRYFFEVRWIHSPCASLAGVVLFQRGWVGKLRWILTGVRLKTLGTFKDKGGLTIRTCPRAAIQNRKG